METYSVRFLLQRGVSVAMVLDTSDPLVTYHMRFGPFSDSLDRLVFPHLTHTLLHSLYTAYPTRDPLPTLISW